MTNLPHIGNNMATQTSDQRPSVEGYTSDGGCLRRGDAGKKVKPTLSVRYTENPGWTYFASINPKLIYLKNFYYNVMSL